MRDKLTMESQLAGYLAALRGPLEIGIEYSILAQRLLTTSGHEIDGWEAVTEGNTMLLMRCRRCGAIAQIARAEVGAQQFMTLELPAAPCTPLGIAPADEPCLPLKPDLSNDAPHGGSDG